MKPKSKPRAKLISALLAAILLICFSAACQPTPETPAIVNKNDGKFEQTLQGAPQPPASYKAPGHWSETVKNDKLKIVIDTDVFVPDVTEFPVIKLERAAFTQQRVDEMVRYFAGDKQLYLPPLKTKSDYEKMIIQLKQEGAEDTQYGIGEDTVNYLEYLEEQRAAAPEDSTVICTDTTLKYQRDNLTDKELTENGKNYLLVMFDNGEGGNACISIDNLAPGINDNTIFGYYTDGSTVSGITESMYESMLEFGGTEEDSGYVGAGALFDNFDKVEITPEQAAARTDEIISGLGIGHLKLAHTQKYVTPDAPESCGYELVYARQSGGITLYSFDGGNWSKDEQPPQYSPPFAEEMLTAYVSKEGLYFSWIGCADVVETVNKNVELLPFDTIQQRLKDQIFYKESFIQDSIGRDFTVTVTSAELRMGYIAVKDDPDKALMVPVWVFESRISFYNEISGTLHNYKDNTYVLNAIDGGVIECPRDSPDEIIEPDAAE